MEPTAAFRLSTEVPLPEDALMREVEELKECLQATEK
jgi:hypothetical protein